MKERQKGVELSRPQKWAIAKKPLVIHGLPNFRSNGMTFTYLTLWKPKLCLSNQPLSHDNKSINLLIILYSLNNNKHLEEKSLNYFLSFAFVFTLSFFKSLFKQSIQEHSIVQLIPSLKHWQYFFKHLMKRSKVEQIIAVRKNVNLKDVDLRINTFVLTCSFYMNNHCFLSSSWILVQMHQDFLSECLSWLSWAPHLIHSTYWHMKCIDNLDHKDFHSESTHNIILDISTWHIYTQIFGPSSDPFQGLSSSC